MAYKLFFSLYPLDLSDHIKWMIKQYIFYGL